MNNELLTSLMTDLGSLGILMWLVHRHTTHTVPRLAKGFTEALEKQRTDFKEALAVQRQDYLDMIKREREISDQRKDV